MGGLFYVSVRPIAKPLNNKKDEWNGEGVWGLGGRAQEGGGTFFQGPHNHYLCLACIAPLSVSLWGCSGGKGGSLAAWPLYLNVILWTEDKAVLKGKKTLTPECLILYVCTIELYRPAFQLSEYLSAFLRYAIHLTNTHLLGTPCHQYW